MPEPPITELLLAALADGGVEAAKRVFRAYMANPIHQHASVEGPMNALGYELLGQGRLDDAIAVFELNVEAYPQSANVYDSLGDGYRARGDR